MDADTLAQIIADYLVDRDDIGTALVADGTDTILVTTQGGINYVISVARG